MNKGKGKQVAVSSPYMSARREWNERYGSYIASARGWKLIAILASVVSIISVSGVVYFGSQNKLIPFVVEVNGRGQTVQSYPLRPINTLPKQVIRSNIAQFVTNVRMVSSDVRVQINAINNMRSFLQQNTPANIAVETWLKQNIPTERAEYETVTIEIDQVLLVSQTAWRVEWRERSRAINGEITGERYMTGLIKVGTSAINEATVMHNPTGLKIIEFDWARELAAK